MKNTKKMLERKLKLFFKFFLKNKKKLSIFFFFFFFCKIELSINWRIVGKVEAI